MSLRRIFFISLVAVVLIAMAGIQTKTQQQGQDIIAGRNVNMVSGQELPGGDPYLQRQNEPSMAVSTRNPLHLLAASNDYRTVMMPGIPEDKLPGPPGNSTAGDAWMGIFRSFDGGESWTTELLPGYPLDPSGEIGDLLQPPVVLNVAADPVVRAGVDGQFFISGIAFFRHPVSKLYGDSALFVARYRDLNDQEGKDTIVYEGTSIVEPREQPFFIDKPWMAVDIPRDGNPGKVYIVYSLFSPDATGNLMSEIRFNWSEDGGVNWSNSMVLASAPMPTSFTIAKKKKDTKGIYQGSTIAIDPRGNGHIYVAWRRFSTEDQSDAIIIARSVNGGKKFHEITEVAEISPFDQGTSPATFRTNSYPSLTIDKIGRLYLIWSQKGVHQDNSNWARIVVSTSRNGIQWLDPQAIDETGKGHQFMPSMTYAGGKLIVAWYDQRNDISGRFTEYIDDRTGESRHTIDVRVAQADPGKNPKFEPSIQVSRYLFVLADDGNLYQAQFNVTGWPLFKGGTTPFIGDYIDICPSPRFIWDGGQWRYNTDPADIPVVHMTWTDFRDVRPPIDNDWSTDIVWDGYTPPESDDCNGQNTGMRNQNIYTSRITQGLQVGSPRNSKQLNTGYQRAFAINVNNSTDEIKSFRLSIPHPALPGGQASFLQFKLLDELDVSVAPYSSISRPVFVGSSDPNESVRINVNEIEYPGGDIVDGGLSSSVVLNPGGATETNPPPLPLGEEFNPIIVVEGIVDWKDYPELNANIFNAGIENATFSVPPLEEIRVVLRLVDPEPGITKLTQAGLPFNIRDFANYQVGGAVTGMMANTGETTPRAAATKLLIGTGYLADGIVGYDYGDPLINFDDTTLKAVGGTLPYSWSIISGQLPPGLDLDTGSGRIFGTPTLAGTYAFFAQVSDNSGQTDIQRFTITINPVTGPGPLTITTTTLPSGVYYDPYAATLIAEGGQKPYTWSLVSGSLPVGLGFYEHGVISGTPKATGTFNLTVQVEDDGGATDTQALSLEINESGTYVTISGTVQVGASGLPGVFMQGLPGTPTTDGNGDYSDDTVPVDWTGTVTPLLDGYTFDPPEEFYPPITGNITTNYTATPETETHTISGTVRLGVEGLPEVTMDGLPGDPQTNVDGEYSGTVNHGWSGTVTPEKDGFTFTPSSTTYTDVDSNQANQDYTVTGVPSYVISGTVTSEGSGLEGVDMGGLPGAPKTDVNGDYSGEVSLGWSGTVTPEKEGYDFDPVSRDYFDVHQGYTNQDYTATLTDTTPPTIISFGPADDATGVDINTNLTITFNENVVAGTGNIEIRKSSDDSLFETIAVTDAKVTIVDNVVCINPDNTFGSLTGYYVNIGINCFKDIAGNYYGGISDWTTWNFTSWAQVAYYPFNGNANDESGNGNNGTAYGATLTADRFGNPNSAYEFNGTSNYIEVPDSNSLDITNEITIAAWVKADVNNQTAPIVEKYRSVDPLRSYLLYAYTTGSLGPRFRVQLTNDIGDVSTTDLLSTTEWSFVVGTYDGTEAKLYINGELKDADSATGLINTNSLPLRIGASNETTVTYFDGKIDDVRIYNRALTGPELEALYAHGRSHDFQVNAQINLGEQALIAGDLRNDGIQRIVSGNYVHDESEANGYIRVYSYTGGNYVEEWKKLITPNTNGIIIPVAVGDVNNDGENEFLVNVYRKNKLQIYQWSGETYEMISEHNIGNDYAPAAVFDIDRDGLNELVIDDVGGISVYEYQDSSLVKVWAAGDGHCLQIAIGDPDGDGEKEAIAFLPWADPGKILVIGYDGSSYAIEATIQDFPLGGLGGGAVADFDKDGKQEMITSLFNVGGPPPEYPIYLVKYVCGNYVVQTLDSATMGMYQIHVGDIDDDGYPEASILRNSTNSFVVEYRSGSYHVLEVVHDGAGIFGDVADVDGDGKPEILSGASGIIIISDR